MYKKVRHQLEHKQLIDHDTDNVAPLPDKTKAPSTNHLPIAILNWMNSTCLILCTMTYHPRVWRLPALPTTASNSTTQLPNYHFELTHSNPLAPSPDHAWYWIRLCNTKQQLITTEAWSGWWIAVLSFVQAQSDLSCLLAWNSSCPLAVCICWHNGL